MADEVLLAEADEILVITINRPAAKNALNQAAARGIAAALAELDGRPDLRVGILTGASGSFCAGMDLKAFLAGETPFVDNHGFGGITECPPRKPLIAAVEGWALAGGFEVMLACDLVVASETAQFGSPEVKRGLFAGAGAAMLLPSRIPTAVALELLLTGDPIDARRAYELGLVNRVVPASGDVLDIAMDLARTIAANGPLALAITKDVVRNSRGWSAAEGWERQRELLKQVFASDDAREGAAAFTDHRQPRWTGH
jgi:enoyl-CoA hydratase